MNKARRNYIEEICAKLYEAQEMIDSVTEDERESYENLPEGIQNSERGDAMYENIDELEDLSSDVQDIIDSLNDIIDR